MDKKELASLIREHNLYMGGMGGKKLSLTGESLPGSCFYGKDLRGVSLINCDLSNSNFIGANLSGAMLSGSNLSNSDMRRCRLIEEINGDLSWACLEGTDLRGCKLDYSAWPLCCGSLKAIVDEGFISQLSYHLCSLLPEGDVRREALKDTANKFHAISDKAVKPIK